MSCLGFDSAGESISARTCLRPSSGRYPSRVAYHSSAHIKRQRAVVAAVELDERA